MRYLIPFMLLLLTTPLAGQTMSDRFIISEASSEVFENRTLFEADSSSPLTASKVFGSIGGTFVGGFAGIGAGFLVANSGEELGAAALGMVAGATVGAAVGAYAPGLSPPETPFPTLGMAALGTAAGIGLMLVAPPLAFAGPPAGALLGFAMAH